MTDLNQHKHLQIFLMILLIITVVYNYYLYDLLNAMAYQEIIIMSIIYPSAIFITGLVLGKLFKSSIQNEGFRYHVITYVTVCGIGLSMNLIYMSDWFVFGYICIGLLFWGIGLFVHYQISKYQNLIHK